MKNLFSFLLIVYLCSYTLSISVKKNSKSKLEASSKTKNLTRSKIVPPTLNHNSNTNSEDDKVNNEDPATNIPEEPIMPLENEHNHKTPEEIFRPLNDEEKHFGKEEAQKIVDFFLTEEWSIRWALENLQFTLVHAVEQDFNDFKHQYENHREDWELGEKLNVITSEMYELHKLDVDYIEKEECGLHYDLEVVRIFIKLIKGYFRNELHNMKQCKGEYYYEDYYPINDNPDVEINNIINHPNDPYYETYEGTKTANPNYDGVKKYIVNKINMLLGNLNSCLDRLSLFVSSYDHENSNESNSGVNKIMQTLKSFKLMAELNEHLMTKWQRERFDQYEIDH